MLKKANISWNARQLSKMINKGTITFDNAVQRGLVWDNDKKSLLIHSMIEGYPIPPIYTIRTESGNYDCIDGKQRSNAITDFITGRFTLSNVPVITLDDGTEVDINGMHFSGLDEEMQDIINSYSLTVYYFEDISDDEVNELFFRLNNGKPLTTYEKYRSRSKTLPEIQRVAAHDYFKVALSGNKNAERVSEDWVLKSYIMTTFKEPCLDSKVTNPTWVSAKLTEDDINNMNAIFDRILKAYNTIIADDSDETGKISKRIASRLLRKTHMFSIIPITKRSIEEGISDEVYTLWVKNFFCGTKSATKYDEYNTRCGSGNGHTETIKIRLRIIKKDYDKFMKQFEKNEEDPVENVEVVETVVNESEINDIVDDVTEVPVVTSEPVETNVETNVSDESIDTETDSVSAA